MKSYLVFNGEKNYNLNFKVSAPIQPYLLSFDKNTKGKMLMIYCVYQFISRPKKSGPN